MVNSDSAPPAPQTTPTRPRQHPTTQQLRTTRQHDHLVWRRVSPIHPQRARTHPTSRQASPRRTRSRPTPSATRHLIVQIDVRRRGDRDRSLVRHRPIQRNLPVRFPAPPNRPTRSRTAHHCSAHRTRPTTGRHQPLVREHRGPPDPNTSTAATAPCPDSPTAPAQRTGNNWWSTPTPHPPAPQTTPDRPRQHPHHQQLRTTRQHDHLVWRRVSPIHPQRARTHPTSRQASRRTRSPPHPKCHPTPHRSDRRHPVAGIVIVPSFVTGPYNAICRSGSGATEPANAFTNRPPLLELTEPDPPRSSPTPRS